MDLVTAIFVSYSSSLGLFAAITVYVEIKNYIIEKYYS
jgi:hypothetical protein